MTEAVQGFTTLAHKAIRPWPGNPRKTFDPEQLAELAGNLKALGMLQPLLVRPKGNRYELADGERRWLAAEMAGLVEVPAIVRPLSDREMLEIAIVSAEQRAELSVLEKAAGYQRLIEEYGATVEEIAGKINKSVSTIHNLLKLQALPEIGREAMTAGIISASAGQLIARVPNPEARLAATCQVIVGDSYREASEKEARQVLAGGAHNDEYPDALSYRDTLAMIGRQYMVQLKGAPFSRKALDLVPDAGSCEECPKRTGNNPEFTGARADVCTDTTCYHRKVEAHHTRLLQAAKESGRRILPKKECEEIFKKWNGASLASDAPWVDLATTCPEVSGGKKWSALVGKQLAEQVVVAVDREDGVHELAPKAAALKIIRKENGSKALGTSQNASEAKWKAQQQEERKRAEQGKEAARRACGLVAKKAEDAWRNLHRQPSAVLQLLRSLAERLPDIVWADACRLVRKRRGIDAKAMDHRGAVTNLAHLSDDAAELFGLLAELVAARTADPWGASHHSGHVEAGEKRFWEAWSVERAKLLKEVAAEKAGPKNGKPSANGHAPADHTGGTVVPSSLIAEYAGVTNRMVELLAGQGLRTLSDLVDLAALLEDTVPDILALIKFLTPKARGILAAACATASAAKPSVNGHAPPILPKEDIGGKGKRKKAGAGKE